MEKQGIKGLVRMEHRDVDGTLLWDSGWKQNVITNAGKGIFSGLIGNVGAYNPFNYLALGTDVSTAPLAAQTALVAEIVDSGFARTITTISQVTTSQTNDTLQLTYTWTATGTKTLGEIGIFNASSSGTMAGRLQVNASTGVALTTNQTFAATYKIQMT